MGIACPPAPPDVSDHLLLAVPSQLAVPPTQYLSAAFALPANPKKAITKSEQTNNLCNVR